MLSNAVAFGLPIGLGDGVGVSDGPAGGLQVAAVAATASAHSSTDCPFPASFIWARDRTLHPRDRFEAMILRVADSSSAVGWQPLLCSRFRYGLVVDLDARAIEHRRAATNLVAGAPTPR